MKTTRFHITICASIPESEGDAFEQELRDIAHSLAERLNHEHPEANATIVWSKTPAKD